MPDTLTISVDAGVSGQTGFRINKTQFGDGYSQRSADGLNNKVDSWNVSKSGPIAEVDPLRDFLDSQAGWKAFYWTPPHGIQGLYTCLQYSMIAKHAEEVTLSATFMQEFSP